MPQARARLEGSGRLIAFSMTVSMMAYGMVLGLIPDVAIWSSAPSGQL